MGYFVPEMTGSRAVGNEKSRGEVFSPARRWNGPSSRSRGTAGQGICVVASATCTSGVRYYGYRHYSPELGRWPSRDPFGEDAAPSLKDYLINFMENNSEISETIYQNRDALNIDAIVSLSDVLPDDISRRMFGVEKYELITGYNERLKLEIKYLFLFNESLNLVDPDGRFPWIILPPIIIIGGVVYSGTQAGCAALYANDQQRIDEICFGGPVPDVTTWFHQFCMFMGWYGPVGGGSDID